MDGRLVNNMVNIKPIETYYNGYRFRSRLEARWAVFFDELNIEYQYEPEGFELSNGMKYLPDFFLPTLRTYVEIKSKGAFEISFVEENIINFQDGREEAIKYAFASYDISKQCNYLICFGEPYDHYQKDNWNSMHLFSKSRCIYNYISNNSKQEFLCECGKCEECPHLEEFPPTHTTNFVFDEDGKHIIPLDDWKNKLVNDGNEFIILPFEYVTLNEEFKEYLSKLVRIHINAALKARQARFEHGEKLNKKKEIKKL